MSISLHEKYKVLIDILKQLHQGVSTSELREKYRDVLQQISPFEIPIIEQHLVKEGLPVTEILKLCDLHVELFKDFIAAREVKDVPESHPLDLLMRENDWILKRAEVLGLYATSLQTTSPETSTSILSNIRFILAELRKIRLHYRKIQMLIFPYLERRGIIAVPRVMWGREDQVVVKLRQLHSKVEDAVAGRGQVDYKVLAQELLALSREISDLVFRENKILFPAIWALLSEGEWAAIAEIADEMGYIVEVGEKKWKPRAKPILPYELEASSLTPDQLEKLPLEFKQVISRGLEPDTYKLVREGDLDLETGFLNLEELKGVFKALPVELTFAGLDRRVRFYSESEITGGFVRTKTILGRRLEYCHPPRLENYVKLNVDALMRGEFPYREFWTRVGDRVLRVIIAGVRDSQGKLVGVLEVVEDLTEVVNNPEEVKKKIVVL
ncbi:MAG: DUF438 domain-containing protein [Desulfurococcaceae archaeon]|nr:DUF438 domain-containing protein [Desulfurococcaceae archaeon]